MTVGEEELMGTTAFSPGNVPSSIWLRHRSCELFLGHLWGPFPQHTSPTIHGDKLTASALQPRGAISSNNETQNHIQHMDEGAPVEITHEATQKQFYGNISEKNPRH